MSIVIISREEVDRHLNYPDCIRIVREAMIALSRGGVMHLPREIVHMDNGRMFGVMLGAMGGSAEFGSKVISVFPQNFALGLQSHQGAVLLFEPENGALVAMVHAGEVTRIRTGAASAVATDALARTNASRLAILGYGEQAEAHALAISQVRALDKLTIWGRDEERRDMFARHMQTKLGIECESASNPAEAVRDADIVCTTTAAKEPILFAADIAPGTHLNIVGSSHAGPSEIDIALVACGRFFADDRSNVLAQGAEFRRAREAGLIDDSHLLAEIGEVLDGKAAGRTGPDDITLYKSLGHIVQDVSSGWHLYSRALEEGFGTRVAF